MIRFTCFRCGERMSVKDSDTNRVAACPKCGQHVPIPPRSEPAKQIPKTPPAPEVIFAEAPPGLVLETEVIKTTRTPPLRKEKWSLGQIAAVAAVFGSIAILGVAATFLNSKPVAVIAEDAERPDEPPPLDLTALKREAVAFAEKRLEKGLIAPKTAEHSKEPEIIVTPITDTPRIRFNLKSHVDAQNRFGVPLRAAWSGILDYDRESKTWSVYYLTLGDDVIESGPEFQKIVRDVAAAIEEGKKNRHPKATQHWSGNGYQKTELFRPPDKGWKISWECNSTPSLSVTVSRPRTSYIEQPISEVKATDGQYIIRRTGEFQLDIQSSGDWDVWIEPLEDWEKR